MEKTISATCKGPLAWKYSSHCTSCISMIRKLMPWFIKSHQVKRHKQCKSSQIYQTCTNKIKNQSKIISCDKGCILFPVVAVIKMFNIKCLKSGLAGNANEWIHRWLADPNANCKIFFIADTENYLYCLRFKIPSRAFRQSLPEHIHRRTEKIKATSEFNNHC